MKKKILLALLLVSMLICLFAISVSAEDMTQYTEFKVQLDGESDYTTVYQYNSDYSNPKLDFTKPFYTGLDQSVAVDKTKIVKIDLSDAEVHGSKVSYIGNLVKGSASDFVNVTEFKFPNRTGFTTIGQEFCKNWTALASVDFGCATLIKNNAFNGCTSLTSITIPTNITFVEDSSFYGCTGITSLTVLGTTKYASNTFMNCTSLSSVSLGSSTNIGGGMFSGCSALTEITIPETVTSIGKTSFTGTNITSVNIPASVTEILEKAFQNISSLKTITFAENSQLKTIVQYAFQGTSIGGEFVLPNGVTTIGNGILSGTLITSAIIPDTVTSAGEGLFQNCSNLTTVRYSKNVTSIAQNAFRKCPKLTTVTNATGVTTIGNYAFESSNAIQNVEIDFSKVTSVATQAFVNASNLAMDIDLSNVTYIGDTAFSKSGITSVIIGGSNYTIGGNAFKECPSLRSVKFVGSGITLSGATFYKCQSLTTLDLTGVKKIGHGCFESNTSLLSVHFSASMETFDGTNHFASCTSLKTVTFDPNAPVTYIPNNFLQACKALETIVFSNNIVSYGSSVFSSCTSLKTVNFGASAQTMVGAVSDSGPGQTWYIPAGFYAASVETDPTSTLFHWQGNQNNNLSGTNNGPKNITFVFTGTKAEAEALMARFKAVDAATGESCIGLSRLYNATLCTEAEYEKLTGSKVGEGTDLGYFFVYGYNTCKAFYQGAHAPKAELRYDFSGEDYISTFCSYADCTRCPVSVETKIVDELFISTGYSRSGDAFMYDIKVSFEAIEAYKNFCNDVLGEKVEINYGLVVSGNQTLEELIDSEGEATDTSVMNMVFDNTVYAKIQVKFNNVLTTEQKALKLHACAYVIENGSVSYIGNGVTAKASTMVCYNDIPYEEE